MGRVRIEAVAVVRVGWLVGVAARRGRSSLALRFGFGYEGNKYKHGVNFFQELREIGGDLYLLDMMSLDLRDCLREGVW